MPAKRGAETDYNVKTERQKAIVTFTAEVGRLTSESCHARYLLNPKRTWAASQ